MPRAESAEVVVVRLQLAEDMSISVWVPTERVGAGMIRRTGGTGSIKLGGSAMYSRKVHSSPAKEMKFVHQRTFLRVERPLAARERERESDVPLFI